MLVGIVHRWPTPAGVESVLVINSAKTYQTMAIHLTLENMESVPNIRKENKAPPLISNVMNTFLCWLYSKKQNNKRNGLIYQLAHPGLQAFQPLLSPSPHPSNIVGTTTDSLVHPDMG
jgi:hypothetical protein